MHWAGRVTVVLAFGVAAFFAGRWTAPEGATPAAWRAPGASVDAGRPGSDRPADDGARPAPADDAAPRQPRAARAAAASADVAADEAAAEEEIPADFGGAPAADITGTLLDRSGNPVVGADVTATPSDATFEEDGERESRILEQITAANTLTAKSDSQGRFRLTGTRASLRYEIRPALVFRAFKAADRCNSYAAVPGAVVDFIATPRGSVRLDVLMPDGTTAPNADVDVKQTWDYDSDREWWTPETRVLSVVPGTVQISAEYGTFRGRVEGVEVTDGREVNAVVRLEERGTVRVRVTCPQGLDMESVSVCATQEEEDTTYRLSSDPRGDLSNGVFTIEGLAFGRWRIVARYPSGRVVASEVVDVGADVREIAWSLPPEDKRDFVIVRVLDPSGAPVSDAVVRGSDSYEHSATFIDARPVGVGKFRLRHGYFGRASEARFVASARSPTFGSTEVEYAAGEDDEVVIRFPPSATVTVRTPGVTSSSCVRIGPELPGDPWSGTSAESAEGRATFDHIPHGTWVVTIDDFPGTAMRITVPCAGEVEYRGEPLRAWRVDDVEAGGRAAAAGLRTGDLIIGIGKTEFRDDRHREALWAAAALEERPVAIVLRGTLRESIPLDPASISPNYIAGAVLEPALR